MALNEVTALAPLLGAQPDAEECIDLDPRTLALVRLGAVVAVGASPVTYQWATEVALAAGASDEEIVGTLLAVAPVSGLARAVHAAPELAIALGYDVDEALDRVVRIGRRND